MKRVQVMLATGVSAVVTLAFATDVSALPVFARKYRTSCLTCHSMTPRLNAFGEAFRLNGFKLDKMAAGLVVKEEPVVMAAEAYKKTWPQAPVWPSDIPGAAPLSIRNRTFFKSDFGTGDAPFDEAAGELEVFTGGSMGEDMSAFGHINVENILEPFDQSQDKEKVKVKVMSGWLALENLGQHLRIPEDLVNLQIGMIGVEEHDFFHYRSHSTYRIDTTKAFYLGEIPYPSGFREKNRFAPRRGLGAELYGFTDRLHYFTSYTVGREEGGGTDLNVGYFGLAYKVGGMDHYGRTDSTFQYGHQEDSLGLGLISSVGGAKVQESVGKPRKTDIFWRLGGDARLRMKDFALHAGTMFGSHDNPYGSLTPEKLDGFWWFVAPEYYMFPWLMLGLRYEQEDLDIPAAANLGDRDRARFHPYVTLLARANVRFTLEGNFYTDRSHDASGRELDHHELIGIMDFAW